MWWLRPVPLIRWTIAAALVGVAFFAEVRAPASVSYPFAAHDLTVGAVIEAADVEWRSVSAGSLPAPDLTHPLRVDIDSGTPLVPAVFTADPVIPPGWWIVDIPLSAAAGPGMEVRIVILEPATSVSGIVVTPSIDDPFGGPPLGAVGVPEEAADLVARAVAVDAVITLISPDRPQSPND